MRYLAVMQVEVVGRGIVRLHDGQVLGSQMRVVFLALQDGEEKREVGVVAEQHVHLAEVLRVVAGDDGEERIELVVGLGEERAVRVREDGGEVGDLPVDDCLVLAIENDGE